jgi:hypothetical protein
MPLCMYGIAPFTVLADTVRLWIFSTQAVDCYPFSFARACRKHLPELRGQFDRATNLVAADDLPVLRWAEWLGCTLALPQQIHGGRLFRQFILDGKSGEQCRSA